MFIVYVITSVNYPSKHYVGFTKDFNNRLQSHNSKKSKFSRKYAPWEAHCVMAFTEEQKARDFERYLKRGSDHAFLKKHII